MQLQCAISLFCNYGGEEQNRLAENVLQMAL